MASPRLGGCQAKNLTVGIYTLRTPTYFLLFAVFLLPPAASHAGTVFFGYNPNTNPGNPPTFAATTFDYLASRFTVGASPLTVNTMTYYAGGNGTVTSSIAIWSAKSGTLDNFQPDTLVAGATANFTPTDTTTPLDIFTVNFAGDVTLNANTNYYVVVDVSGVTGNSPSSGFTASTASSSNFTAFGGTDATPANRVITSSNNGINWSSFSGASFLPYTVGFTPAGGAAVPEPSTFLFGLIGTVSLSCVRRRRARS
jgi:hypothetical protein